MLARIKTYMVPVDCEQLTGDLFYQLCENIFLIFR